MVNDTVSDMFTRIRNAHLRKKKDVSIIYSKLNEAIAKVLLDRGYISDVSVFKEKDKKYKSLSVTLKYDEDNLPKISSIESVSRPGLRIYVGANNIKLVLGGLGLTIISTPKGVMSGKDARKRKLGGEVICKVF